MPLDGRPEVLQSLRDPFPEIPMIASGGVNQVSAADYIRVGAVALGIGAELIPRAAVESRNTAWIAELARRFLKIVKETRASLDRP